jgi:hypothetical protein
MNVHCETFEMLEFVYNHANLKMRTSLNEMWNKYGKELILSTSESSYGTCYSFGNNFCTINDYCNAHNIRNPFNNNELLIQIL